MHDLPKIWRSERSYNGIEVEVYYRMIIAGSLGLVRLGSGAEWEYLELNVVMSVIDVRAAGSLDRIVAGTGTVGAISIVMNL